jgi:outer membrane protein OmpA-like peptidoglycan-associated protein
MNDDTPWLLQWSKKKANYVFKAYSPPSTLKDIARLDIKTAKVFTFAFTLSFEYNGYDIRNARVTRVLQESTGLNDEKFATRWKAKKAVPLNAERAQIDFLLDGTWAPTTGSKNFSFTGKLSLRSDGWATFDLDKNENVQMEWFAGATWWTVNTVNLAKPARTEEWKTVLFDPQGSDRISDKEMLLLKAWVQKIKDNDVRFRRIVAGTIPINVTGYASATGAGDFNQKLSGSRADKVIKLLKDYLGQSIKVNRFAYGEKDPTVSKKDEKDDYWERRADITFEVLG